MNGICKLCQKQSQLEVSHILPKFIFRWITKTSATGKLRGLGKPNVPVQDGTKLHLLCASCEDKFSKYETWFANKFFHPSIKGLKTNYDYDETLFKFVISLFWRTIVINIDREIYNESPLKSQLLKCENELRQFLLKDTYPTNFEHTYIAMTSYVDNAPSHIKGINHYFTRSADNQIVFNNTGTKMYFYCVIPYFIFVGNIVGLKQTDFVNAMINPIGGHFTTTSMMMQEPSVSNFMESQINKANSVTLSENQQKILESKILENIDKYVESKSFEATFLDKIREG
jgi:hypothetical protein